MMRNMKMLERETEKRENLNRCPICGINGGNGVLCETHMLDIKDFDWIRNYLNKKDKVDSKDLYVIECAISDRKSYVINYVPIIHGKMMIKEYLNECLEKGKCSEFLERMLKEIIALEDAKIVMIDIMKNNGSGGT